MSLDNKCHYILYISVSRKASYVHNFYVYFQMLRDIILYEPGCTDVLYLDNLYYCVKLLTDQLIVLFNGSNYIIACVTESEHTLVVNIKARKLDSDRTAVWIQRLADKLQEKYC